MLPKETSESSNAGIGRTHESQVNCHSERGKLRPRKGRKRDWLLGSRLSEVMPRP